MELHQMQAWCEKRKDVKRMPDTVKPPHVLNARDICSILGISLNNTYALMRSAGFPSIRVSARRYVVPQAAFEQWLEEQAHQKKAGG